MTELEQYNVIEAYSRIAKSFSATRPKPWNWIIDFYHKLYNINPKANILDHGCGGGRNMNNICIDGEINTKTNFTFLGIDSCQEFVNIANDSGYNAYLSDMCKMINIDSNSFDAIVSIASFHHLSSVERRIQALQELFRVMKSGALCLMSVWSITQPQKSKNHNKFTFGDNIVSWKDKQGNVCANRYYYIFKVTEIQELITDVGFIINNCKWDYGNTVIEFTKP